MLEHVPNVSPRTLKLWQLYAGTLDKRPASPAAGLPNAST
jgi:hypothetical protein